MLGKTNVKVKPNKKVNYVEYIESTGTQYIDTLICPYKTKTEVTFQYTGTKSISGAGYVLASWTTNNNRYYPVAYTGTISSTSTTYNSFRTANKENIYTALGAYDTNVHTLIYNDENNKVYFDGVLKTTVSDLSTSTTNSIYLFGMHGSTGAEDLLACRIMSVKFTNKETGELIGDFRPVKDGAGVYCMYDEVEKRYYYNQGTGEFIGEGTIYFTSSITPTTWTDVQNELEYTATNDYGEWRIWSTNCYSDNPCKYAFDNGNLTTWRSSSYTDGNTLSYIGICLPVGCSICPKNITIISYAQGNTTHYPKLLGLNEASGEWEELHTLDRTTEETTENISLTTDNFYSEFKLELSRMSSSSAYNTNRVFEFQITSGFIKIGGGV